MHANVEKQREAEFERQELTRVIEENRRIEEEQARKFWEKQHNYQSDLVGQIEYNQRLRQDQFEREEQEYIKGKWKDLVKEEYLMIIMAIFYFSIKMHVVGTASNEYGKCPNISNTLFLTILA